MIRESSIWRATRILMASSCLLIPLFANDPNFRVHYNGDARLSVLSGEAAASTLDRVLAMRPEFGAAKHLAFTLVNIGSTPILGITVRWSWINAQGKRSIHDHTSDSLFLTTLPVIVPQQRVVVFPGSFAAEFSSGLGIGGLEPRETVRQFDAASDITASIDCVIFGDGTVSGPDESGTKKSLRARRMAAVEIASVVLNALTVGQQPLTALQQYERDVVGKGTPEEQQWRRQLIQGLKRRPTFLEPLAKQYINLPAIPASWQ